MFPVHPELPGIIVDWYVTTLIKTPGRAPATKDAPAIPAEVHILDQIDQPGGAAKVRQLLEETRKHDPKATLFSEANVNFVGYDHIQSGDSKGAIEILKLNIDAYSNSPNVYDSLFRCLSCGWSEGSGTPERQESAGTLTLRHD